MGQNVARSRPTFHPTRTALLALVLAVALLIAAGPAWSQTIRYYHTDVTGSVVAVTDDEGHVVERRQYEPYGLPQSAIPDGPGYTGHDMDGETGLIYMQQRYYDPMVGRFISQDPMAVDTTTAWNFNRYNYAANNPYRYTDPDGRNPLGILAGITVEIAWQIEVEGRTWENLDKSNIAVAGAIGAFFPGGGTALIRMGQATPKIGKALRAISVLESRLVKARTLNRVNKLQGGINRNAKEAFAAAGKAATTAGSAMVGVAAKNLMQDSMNGMKSKGEKIMHDKDELSR